MGEISKTYCHFLLVDIKGSFQCGTSLVLIDYCSRYPVITPIKTINNESMVKPLKVHFYYLAIQQIITINNGPQLIYCEFKIYLSTHNIEHRIAMSY